MEYSCKIVHNPENVYGWHFVKAFAVRLPLFDQHLKIDRNPINGDFLLFLRDDRHSIGKIYIYPPGEITEEEFKIINQKWNECIENDLDYIDFDL